MADHLPLKATCIVTSQLKNKTDAFHQKIVLFATRDHGDVKYKYETLLSKHENK